MSISITSQVGMNFLSTCGGMNFLSSQHLVDRSKTLSHKHGESVCGDMTRCTNFTPRFVSIQDRHMSEYRLSILDSYFFKRCSSDVVSHEGLEFLIKVELIKVRLTIQVHS